MFLILQQMKSLVNSCLKRIKDRQNKQGLFGMWYGDSHNLWVSAQVLHAVALCKEKGKKGFV